MKCLVIFEIAKLRKARQRRNEVTFVKIQDSPNQCLKFFL
jgi:hypothetical protein